jgi:hypothetical protein
MPVFKAFYEKNAGAARQDRTVDLSITNGEVFEAL